VKIAENLAIAAAILNFPSSSIRKGEKQKLENFNKIEK